MHNSYNTKYTQQVAIYQLLFTKAVQIRTF